MIGSGAKVIELARERRVRACVRRLAELARAAAPDAPGEWAEGVIEKVLEDEDKRKDGRE